MNQGRLNEMIEQATEQERHQFYAGSYGFIVELNNRLTAKRMAEGQRKEELGEPEDDIDSN